MFNLTLEIFATTRIPVTQDNLAYGIVQLWVAYEYEKYVKKNFESPYILFSVEEYCINRVYLKV